MVHAAIDCSRWRLWAADAQRERTCGKTPRYPGSKSPRSHGLYASVSSAQTRRNTHPRTKHLCFFWEKKRLFLNTSLNWTAVWIYYLVSIYALRDRNISLIQGVYVSHWGILTLLPVLGSVNLLFDGLLCPPPTPLRDSQLEMSSKLQTWSLDVLVSASIQ